MKSNIWIAFIMLITAFSCTTNAQQQNSEFKSDVKNKVIKAEAEWAQLLTPEEFRVLREKGTERAFTGEFWNHKKNGEYHCAACNHHLFSSKHKFKSGTGWPSYFDVATDSSVVVGTDKSYGMVRDELLCAKCGGHLGHVFNDGPKPTGLRYCINSISLKFKPNN